MRNTYIQSSHDYSGNIPTAQLQTQNTYIDLTARNQVTIITGDFYILFFGFPLRNNGIVSNACKRISDGLVLGPAYYHQNIWAIVCEFTSNSLTAPASSSTTTTLRIEGFYTPWFYLQTS